MPIIMDQEIQRIIDKGDWVTEKDIKSIEGFPLYWKDYLPGVRSLKDVCGYIKDGYMFWFSSVCRYIFGQEIQEAETKKVTEKKLEDALVEQLKSEYEIIRQLKTTYGRIDIYAKKDGEEFIFEIKKKPTGPAILRALGQLLAYSQDYPNAKLIFCSNKSLSKKYEELLHCYNIDIHILRRNQ